MIAKEYLKIAQQTKVFLKHILEFTDDSNSPRAQSNSHKVIRLRKFYSFEIVQDIVSDFG